MERPHKLEEKWTGKHIAPGEKIEHFELDYGGKRDRWNGYDISSYAHVSELYEVRDEAKRKYLKEKQLRKLEEKNNKDNKAVGDSDKEDCEDALKVDETKVNKSKEDTSKYLLNLDVNSAHYDPKTRSMCEDPFPDMDSNEKFYVGVNQNRVSGQVLEFKKNNIHAWEAFEKGHDVHMQAAPSQVEFLYKNYKINKEKLKVQSKDDVMEKYGNESSDDTLPRELLLGQSEKEIEYDRAGRIMKGQFKAIGLDESEYFTSLEETKNNNSYVTTARGNLASMFFGKLSLTGSNFGEPKDSMNSLVSTKVNALMANSTDMDEKFAMREQNIKALKKSVDDKNLYIAQLMNKLEAYKPGVRKASSFIDRMKEEREFKKYMTLKTKESMAVKASSVKVTTKKKVKEDKGSRQYPKEDKCHPTLKELEAKVYPFLDSDVPMLPDELLVKKIIDLPKLKRPEKINKVNDPKYCKYYRVVGHPTGKFFIFKDKIITLFRSFDPVGVDFLRKTLKESLVTDNKAKVNDDDDGWTLVSRKKKRHQAILGIRLFKPRVMKNNAEHLRPPKSVKFDTRKKIDGALSRKDQSPITLYEFFPEKFLEDSQIDATHVITSTEEVNERKGGHCPTIAQDLHANREVESCCAYVKDGKVVKINADVNPFTETESYFADAKFYLNSCELGMEKPTLSNPTNVVAKEVEVQRAAVKMPKERIEKFSTKISSSKGDMHTKMDEEHLIFHYIPRDSRKEGQPLLEVCTQQSHPPRRETSHKPFQDLKKIMTIPIIQVPSITPELLGSNTLAHQIKGQFG
ncbi:Pre-mRNA-splicing factor SLU7 [Capsicum annuum]|uniref:Pre-mRNA-splicing factor SLU7 n=1 Tax=Capsicum annuum TaxID=4072 RepID=A0A2G2ZXU3_CAPAN|nr:Pre-mRNA-splicing factor SLU7 [Capsicum annuum]